MAMQPQAASRAHSHGALEPLVRIGCHNSRGEARGEVRGETDYMHESDGDLEIVDHR